MSHEQFEAACNGLLLGMDLFFVSKIQGTAQLLGSKIETVTSKTLLQGKLAAGSYKYLLIDLEAFSGELEFLKQLKIDHPSLKIIAFGSHVNTERLASAQENGADSVLPRSKFTMNLAAILESAIKS
jgi:DNA-binding NarL/FixJ family response regulator